jgi:hypothetical protein
MNPRYPRVAERALHRCEYCLAPEVAFNIAFEVEHIHPSSAGGLDGDDNLALCCGHCNLHKSDNIAGPDSATGEEAGLFNPRLDRWEDHFAVELDSSVAAKTAIGRATVGRLRMNSDR